MDQATIFTGILIFVLLVLAAISYGMAFKYTNWKRPACAMQGALLVAISMFLSFHLIKHLIQNLL